MKTRQQYYVWDPVHQSGPDDVRPVQAYSADDAVRVWAEREAWEDPGDHNLERISVRVMTPDGTTVRRSVYGEAEIRWYVRED